MKRIFLTVANNSSSVPLIKHLKENGYEVFAGDLNPDSIGRFFCDKFIILPRQNSDDYIPTLLKIMKDESIDILIPSGELECLKIAKNKNRFLDMQCIPVVTNIETLELSLEKIDSYNFLVQHTDIPFMRFHLVESLEDLEIGLAKLGRIDLAIKPSQGSGSRGFAILTEQKNDAESFFNNKSSFAKLSIDELKDMLARSKQIPKLILMEMLNGIHYDSNMICKNGEVLFQSIRTREETINGTITKATIVKNEELFEINRKIAKALKVDGYICTQYIGNKLIEINPRWSTSINYKNFNEYLMALDLAQDKQLSVKMNSYKDYESTKFIKYFDTFVYKD
jgi:carbamoylphosphate synthase large subunit